MNEKCKKCVYYSGDDVLLPHCFHLNSAIVPGWNQYYEDKECPEFVNKEDYYNKLKAFLDANIDQFIKSEVKGNKLQSEQVSSKHHYIGKYVHAGGELNGIVGHIVDVKYESDDIFGEELWFYIKDEEDGTIHKYGKEEIQEIVIGITYKEDD